eukprot:Rmarinus@m.21863
MDDLDEAEDTYVVIDLPSSVEGSFTLAAIGLGSKTPVFMINNKLYQATLRETLGTQLLFATDVDDDDVTVEYKYRSTHKFELSEINAKRKRSDENCGLVTQSQSLRKKRKEMDEFDSDTERTSVSFISKPQSEQQKSAVGMRITAGSASILEAGSTKRDKAESDSYRKDGK